MTVEHQLRERILALVGEYAELAHDSKPFVPGKSPVPVSGKVYGEHEIRTLVDSALDFWLTTGRFNDAFENRLEEFLGVKYAITANSGSSANLLAVAALTSPELGSRSLKAGDEVIAVAAAFPTTINPLLQYGLVPVFADIQLPTYNINPDHLEAAVSEKTRAIFLAHTLGNPFQLDEVVRVSRKYDLWVIEDCCDALGSTFRGQLVGTFGDLATLSFYPAHHITMGEGGGVFTNQSRLKMLVESFRDWGRSCYCPTGKDNTCGKRFDWQLGELPYGYDHKYIYTHTGYNLKITDMQAAVGFAQMDRLEGFIRDRKSNFAQLLERLAACEEYFVLPEPTLESDPSWFGFPLTIRRSAPFGRDELLRHLDGHLIGFRLLFGGNLVRQPYFQGTAYRCVDGLPVTDQVMRDTFWLGVYPGLTPDMLDFVADTIMEFIQAKAGG